MIFLSASWLLKRELEEPPFTAITKVKGFCLNECSGKNQFVKSQLTDALIKLMCKKPLRDISVSELALYAQVGRASFYRNYKEKEDILREYTAQLLEKWRCGYEKHGSTDISEMFGSLFAHFKSNKKYYSLLYRQGL